MTAPPSFSRNALPPSLPKIKKSHWTLFPARFLLPLSLKLRLFPCRAFCGFYSLSFFCFSQLRVFSCGFFSAGRWFRAAAVVECGWAVPGMAEIRGAVAAPGAEAGAAGLEASAGDRLEGAAQAEAGEMRGLGSQN